MNIDDPEVMNNSSFFGHAATAPAPFGVAKIGMRENREDAQPWWLKAAPESIDETIVAQLINNR
ncbi:hypothetical protein [Acidovorax sp. NB1]|uniref:hypothetical protein n=1 Tax=Acidovorax sp. NB1 TaxID=1943571 RepID=UPI0010F7856A|nr:hypothetical protein [Acidovorax sp. NB1]